MNYPYSKACMVISSWTATTPFLQAMIRRGLILTMGAALGQVVKNIRNKQTFSDYREELEALGLVYDGKFALILRAIDLWQSFYDDNINNVPVRWCIPKPPDTDSKAWPSELHGMHLGETLRRIRKNGCVFEVYGSSAE